LEGNAQLTTPDRLCRGAVVYESLVADANMDEQRCSVGPGFASLLLFDDGQNVVELATDAKDRLEVDAHDCSDLKEAGLFEWYPVSSMPNELSAPDWLYEP
jgi:hypothetical protein